MTTAGMQWTQRGFAAAALLTLCLTTSLASNPGIRAVITANGLHYADEVGSPIILTILSSAQLPDISGHASVADLGINYWLTDIRQYDLNMTSSSLTSGSSGLTVQAAGITAVVWADWKYEHSSWPHFKDHGTCEIFVSGMSLSVSATMGSTPEGSPTVSLTQCSLDVGHFKVDFHGGASWLYNLFDDYISDKFKDELKGQLCGQMIHYVTLANTTLSSLPMMYRFGGISELSYKLIKAPFFASTYVESENQGEFYLIAKPVEAPYTPHPLPPVSGTSRMVYIWLTDYVLNTAGWVYYKAGLLNFNITPNMVPPSAPFQLNTSYFAQLIPELYKKYPNMSMVLGLSAVETPVVNIYPNSTNVTVNGHINVYVIDSNNVTHLAFILGADVYADGRIWVQWNATIASEIIKGYLNQLKTNLSIAYSDIGNFSLVSLQSILDLAYKEIVIPKINQYGNTGYPVPAIEGLLKLLNTAITLEEGYAVISTDLKYGLSLLGQLKTFTGV